MKNTESAFPSFVSTVTHRCVWKAVLLMPSIGILIQTPFVSTKLTVSAAINALLHVPLEEFTLIPLMVAQ
jgi:hypothetical protein